MKIELDDSALTLHGLQQYYLTIHEVCLLWVNQPVERKDQEVDGSPRHAGVQSDRDFCEKQLTSERTIEYSKS